MAAPATVLYSRHGARDAKGNTSRLTFLLGGATTAAIQTASGTINTDLQAVSNAHIYNITFATGVDRTYGSAANYLDVEDKAILTFYDPQGFLHRFQIPAPKTAGFLADQETVDSAETNMAALIAAIVANAYGRATDTSPLAFVGGTRLRRKLSRKLTLFTKNPALTGPGE